MAAFAVRKTCCHVLSDLFVYICVLVRVPGKDLLLSQPDEADPGVVVMVCTDMGRNELGAARHRRHPQVSCYD